MDKTLGNIKAQDETFADLKKDFTHLNQIEQNNSNEGETQKKTQTTKLLELIEDIELFHDEQDIPYATICVRGHKETYPVESKQFRRRLSNLFWNTYKKGLSNNIVTDAILAIAGKACNEGVCCKIYKRIAEIKGIIYIDLVNQQWDVIKISNQGWEIAKDCPVKFTRGASMRELPKPEKGGDINSLWKYVNIPEKGKKLILAFLLECFRINTPFPILLLYGLQGSAKSTTQDILRRLIDPSASNLRSAPKKPEDLMVAAINNWLVSFNNISHLSESQQDELCCLSTGGGFATRELFTTNDELVADIKRPVMMNGIADIVTAQDLIDRCISLELPPISKKERRSDAAIIEDFNLEYPKLFGSLLDLLAKVLQEIPNIDLPEKPRMADFAILGAALEKVMDWSNNSFLQEYYENIQNNMTRAMEHSPVVVALTNFIEDNKLFNGSYGELYRKLTSQYKPDMNGWPKSPRGLATQIKRQSPALSAIGFEIVFGETRTANGYTIYIIKRGNKVHQVHEVHQLTRDKACDSEHNNELTSIPSQSTSHVHGGMPRQCDTDAHNELSEHRDTTNTNDREVISL